LETNLAVLIIDLATATNVMQILLISISAAIIAAIDRPSELNT
jgi:hypothetical protein